MLEKEVVDILGLIDNGENFLLSGGAGSGKTYSLVQVIQESLRQHPSIKIACMTYTNAAAKEVLERIDHQNLDVGTIHDFLWRIVRPFQRELKKILVELHNDTEDDRIRYTGTDIALEDLQEEKVEYREYVAVRSGIVSHDEVIKISEALFASYPKLSHIAQSMYPLILVDEYQDTSPDVVRILLDHFRSSGKSAVVGFFGDSMQSIYDKTVGDLNDYLGCGRVREVVKQQNRRNPQSVIDIANAVRNDGLTQLPSSDESAPNMTDGQVKKGVVRFIYSMDSALDTDEVRNGLGWDFSDAQNTKELNLTHNLNAPRAGYPTLMDIYDKDKILDYKKRISRYVKRQGIETDFSGKTFGEVVDSLVGSAANKQQVLPTAGMQRFIDENPELLALARAQDYEVFRKLFVSKEQLIDDKKDSENEEGSTRSTRDDLIKHLFSIQSILFLYSRGEVSDFLKRTDLKVHSLADKQRLADAITKLRGMSDASIGEVLEFCDSSGLRRLDDRIKVFKTSKPYLYHRLSAVRYKEFMNLFEYLEGRTPFSTQHKVKGNEFERVFVALDNGNWNFYNFEYLFSESGTASVLERSRKIFYVCCTRAREELVVYFNGPSEVSIEKAKLWFGEDNVTCIDKTAEQAEVSQQ